MSKLFNEIVPQLKTDSSGGKIQELLALDEKARKEAVFLFRKQIRDEGPSNAEELHNYCRIMYGFNIPVTACSEDANAPFEWAYSFYFDKHPQTFAIGSRGGGKALALDTPILTTNGLKTMGTVEVGDKVFNENLQPTIITHVHPVLENKKCYKVCFYNSRPIVADAEHLWTCKIRTTTFSYHEEVCTTQELFYLLADDYVISVIRKDIEIQLFKVEETESVPVRCITVDNRTHLYCAGYDLIPTHNSYPAAFLTDMKCRFRQGYEAVHTAALKKQAEVTQNYLAGFYKDAVLKDEFTKRPGKTSAEWKNGSSWNVVTGSQAGVSGWHPSQLCLDEIEFFDISAIEQAYAVPQPKNGYPKQLHMFSTRQRCLPYYTRVVTEDGPMKIGHLVNTKYAGKVKSWNTETSEWEWKRVINWYRNGSSREWYKVYLEYTGLGKGCELIATGNHQVYVNSTTKKPLEEFKVGEHLCVPSWVPDNAQTQVVYGTLLGDGSLDKDGKLRIEHGSNQLEYLNWKSKSLSDLPYLATYNKDRLHTLHVHANCAYTHRLRKEWYPNGIKRIPDYVWDKLDVLGLAVWIMDDGCVTPVGSANGGIYITLFALHFNEHERIKATEWFANKGIFIEWKTYQKSRITGEPLYHIRISKQNAWNVLAMISPYLSAAQHMGQGTLKSKGRKNWIAKPLVPNNKKEGFELVPIRAIEKIQSAPIGMYDIEVEDNHNFLNGSNVLVSNSFGTSNYLTNQIEQGKKNIIMFKWTIFETMQRCPSCVCLKGGRVISNPEEACLLWEDCIKWDQLIQTSNRGPVQIKDLTTKDKVFSWSDGKLTVNKIEKVWSKGVKKTYAVTTLHRKRIEGTYEHPVLTAQYEKLSYNRGKWSYEWKPLGSLTKKDLIVTVKEIGTDKECHEVNGVHIDDDLLYLLGLYIGDGSLERYKLHISEFDSERVASIHRIVKNRWGANCSTTAKKGVSIYSVALVKDFEALGITKKLSFEKTLPDWLWKLSKEQIKTFIAGYVDSDGNVQKHGEKVTTAIASTSYTLLQQIRNLCLFVGYTHIGSVTLRKRKLPIIINGKQLNEDTIKPIYSFEFRTGSKKSISYLYDNIPSLQKFLPSDDTNFRLETVFSIEETGEHEVYDISVENDHNFIAEGIVVHNCHGLLGTKSSGWVPREEAINLKATLGPDQWEVQYLCKRPSSHGLVLYNFVHEYVTPQDLKKGNYIEWEYVPSEPYYICHDPAEGQKSVVVFFQIWNGKIFAFDELVDENCFSVTKVKQALWERMIEKGYPNPECVIVDPHREDAGYNWAEGEEHGEGVNKKYKVSYPRMDSGLSEIEKGLELLRTFICDGAGRRRFFINPKMCPEIDTTTREHHYKIGKDNVLNDTAKPSDTYKDGCDVLRYFTIWATQFAGLREVPTRLIMLGE